MRQIIGHFAITSKQLFRNHLFKNIMSKAFLTFKEITTEALKSFSLQEALQTLGLYKGMDAQQRLQCAQQVFLLKQRIDHLKVQGEAEANRLKRQHEAKIDRLKRQNEMKIERLKRQIEIFEARRIIRNSSKNSNIMETQSSTNRPQLSMNLQYSRSNKPNFQQLPFASNPSSLSGMPLPSQKSGFPLQLAGKKKVFQNTLAYQHDQQQEPLILHSGDFSESGLDNPWEATEQQREQERKRQYIKYKAWDSSIGLRAQKYKYK